MAASRKGVMLTVGAVAVAGIIAGLGIGAMMRHPSPAPHAEAPQIAAPAIEFPAPVPEVPLPEVPVPEAPITGASAPVNTGDDVNGPAVVQPYLAPPEAQAVAPKRSGQPAWRKYAVAAPAINGRPMIAVVIDDLGLDRKRAERVIALKAPLTLAFMTYAEDLPRLTKLAHAQGHELMVHMPMQPLSDGFNAGPQTLTVGTDAAQLRGHIAWGLSRFDGYVGVNNHMGSRFTGDAAGMAVVMEELSVRGLMFLDSVTTPHSVAATAAARHAVPFAARQVFLDNEQSIDAVRGQLDKTEAFAKKHGFAIAIGHPHDTTVAALSDWLQTVESRGFVLVPVTTIVTKAHTKG